LVDHVEIQLDSGAIQSFAQLIADLQRRYELFSRCIRIRVRHI